LYQGVLKYELVIHNIKFPEELRLIEKQGIKIYRLADIVKNLSAGQTIIQSAAGSALLELVMLGCE
jgi:hypothetical protein